MPGRPARRPARCLARPLLAVRLRLVHVAAALAVLAPLLAASGARADDEPAQAAYRLGGRGDQPHAGMPFVLDVLVEGFEEQPAPALPPLALPDADVAPAGADPSVARSIQIINGRRIDATQVRWALHYRVTPRKAGRLRLPALTVAQGARRATAPAAEVEVDEVPMTDDMKLALELPARPIFVGETVPVTLRWLLRRDPQEQELSIPLLGLPDVTVSAPPVTDPRQALELAAGARTLQVPYVADDAEVDGARYRRISFTFFVAPRTPGPLAVPASSVAAALAVGRPDFFGRAATRMFRAVDVARTLEVKPLPQADKPASFAGAVGASFSIAARTSRSVVEIGEPVELELTVKGDQRLDTLALGRLDGDGGLPRDRFTVPADPPTGTLSADGKTKTFKVAVQVTGPATEVPAIAFSYFDPVKGAYQTVHSDPIALSVKGGAVVGAGDVVSAARPTAAAPAAPAGAEVSLDGVELALSSPAEAAARPLGGALLWLLVAALHLGPLALLLGRRWQLRTAGDREEAAEVRAARRRVAEELAHAATAPGRETAGRLGAALRALARALDRAHLDDDGLLERIETESFAPGAATAPLSAALRAEVEALVARWAKQARQAPRAARGGAGVAALLLALAAPAAARADVLADGRAAYQEAMRTTDATARRAAFARAARLLDDAAYAAPDHPAVLVDRGNAALGSGDVAQATLAYRRALALDPGDARALRALAWLRGRQPEAFRPAGAGAVDALFFFHQWPRARRLLVGAAAFALAMLVLVPWQRGRRAWRVVALLPLAAWAAMVASVGLEDRRPDDAVVREGVALRAADSPGAPATMSQALPPGAEVVVLEAREGWTRVRIASGATGWVPAPAVERVRRSPWLPD